MLAAWMIVADVFGWRRALNDVSYQKMLLANSKNAFSLP